MAMRVGLLHYTAPPIVGGVEIVIGKHARLLVDAGHRVRIITGRGGRTGERVEVIRIALADTRHPLIRELRVSLDDGRVPATFARLSAELYAALRQAVEDLDVLVAHNVCSLHFNLALTDALRRLAADDLGPPLIAWHHDIAATSGRHVGEFHPGEPWDLLRSAWPGVTYVAISEARRAEVATATGIDAEAIRVVPNGIDVESFLGLSPATRRLIGPLRLPVAGPVLLAPARITPRKNLELAIAVVAELRGAGDDARLIVTGPPDQHEASTGAYQQRLSGLAAELGVTEAVHFLARGRTGRTPPRVVADLYRLADALLITSRDEGFGLTLLEAAVCRLPVVCADLPPLRALAGADATYFDPEADPVEVARLIRRRLLSEATARFAARVRSSLGWPVIYERQIEPLLREVAERDAMMPVGSSTRL